MRDAGLISEVWKVNMAAALLSCLAWKIITKRFNVTVNKFVPDWFFIAESREKKHKEHIAATCG